MVLAEKAGHCKNGPIAEMCKISMESGIAAVFLLLVANTKENTGRDQAYRGGVPDFQPFVPIIVA